MTPASLRRNYLEEIKKCGDLLYRKNQYWEWVSSRGSSDLESQLATVLNLSVESVRKHGGAWLVNIKNESNYASLSSVNKASLDEQIDAMIQSKYTFINYNGLRKSSFKQLTSNYDNNIFDNAVVIVDEAHNLISRIVNKLSKMPTKKHTSDISMDSLALPLQLYEFLLKAKNARVVFLTGTPVINYPNEIGVLFNMLRGYINSWKFTLSSTSSIDLARLKQIFINEKNMDYIDYAPNTKTLTVTRNPYGFESKITERSGYKGVSNEEKERVADGKTTYVPRGAITDAEFVTRITKTLKKNNITTSADGTRFSANTALPDTLAEFTDIFINKQTGEIENSEKLKKRIMGLTSYFRSAQEELLPKYDKNIDLHVVRVPMSDYQFAAYEKARVDERKLESRSKKNKQSSKVGDELYKEPSSTYRIFSRLFCNFAMPKPPGRPMPVDFYLGAEDAEDKDDAPASEGADKAVMLPTPSAKSKTKKATKICPEGSVLNVVTNRCNKIKGDKKTRKNTSGGMRGGDDDNDDDDDDNDNDNNDDDDDDDDDNNDKITTAAPTNNPSTPSAMAPMTRAGISGDEDDVKIDELEGDELIDLIPDSTYKEAIRAALAHVASNKSEYLNKSRLGEYSPKFLAMLETIQSPDNLGSFLIYSQFRSIEGIELFSMVLDANGFARFRIKKNNVGQWVLNMSEQDAGKPTYALYTGTETAEEREIIRNVYNGDWDKIPNNIAAELKKKANNNAMGEIIKIIMITSAGSEGINLTNTRFVLIMEPYWHPVRVEQVIGRARRICSHKALPLELQTVEVYIYISVITEEQLLSENSVELRIKDTSQFTGLPQTSDEKLLEISNIKERINSQLLKSIKESSIDCATHIRSGNKENLTCLSFGNPSPSEFSYKPNYSQDDNDTINRLNKITIDWEAKELTVDGRKMILRVDTNQIYDYDSVLRAREVPGTNPVLIGELKKQGDKYVIKTV